MQRLRGLECKWLRLPVSLQVKPRTNTRKHPQNESLLKVQGSDPSHEQGLGGSGPLGLQGGSRVFRVLLPRVSTLQAHDESETFEASETLNQTLNLEAPNPKPLKPKP